MFEAVFADLDTYVRECNYPNWDGEDAWPISPEITVTAKEFVREVAAAAGEGWVEPDTGGPPPDGGALLVWEVGPRSTMVCLEHDGRFGCVRQQEGEPPSHEYLSREDTIKAVLWVLGSGVQGAAA